MHLDLSVVIPTFNEIARLPKTLDEIYPFLDTRFPYFEIIIVDDNSPDGTAAYATEYATRYPRIKVIVQPCRLGKGAAVRRGCLAAEGKQVLFMDADHATPIDEVLQFSKIMLERQCDAVVGVRTYQEGESKWRRILGMCAQILAHLLVFDKAVFDSQCGFKMFTKEAAKNIFSFCRVNGGMLDVELFYVIHRLELACVYQPVHWVNKAGSRINIIRCLFQDTWELLKIRYRRMANIYSTPLPFDKQPWR